MTSPVDELRAAATKLRTLAEAATPGPWQHTGSGPGHEYKGCGTVYTTSDDLFGGEIAAPAGDCYPRGGYSPDGDMAYIATMHPGVAVALADWLAAIAATCERRDAVTLEMGVEQALNGGGS